MIKYSWATYKGKSIHISEVTPRMREEDHFYNLVTDKRMTAYLQGKFKPHFHHFDPAPHDNETYLHETAKAVFRETFTNCLDKNLPYYLEFWTAAQCINHHKKTGITCPVDDINRSFDLTKKFRHIQVEKGFQGFIPDIQLQYIDEEKLKEVLFIEIFVTHKSSAKKLQAGKRLIEIKIDNEDDILKLRKKSLSVTDKNVTFYNFKKNLETIDYCSQRERGCTHWIETFILFKDGSYEFRYDKQENIISIVSAEENRIAKVIYSPFHNRYQYAGLTDNEKEKLFLYDNLHKEKIRDCRFCRYKADKIGRGKNLSLFCKFLKKDINYDTAWSCEYFRLPNS